MRILSQPVVTVFLLILLTCSQILRSEAEEEATCSSDDGTCHPPEDEERTNSKSQTEARKKKKAQNQGEGSVWKIPPNVLGRSQEAAKKAQMGHGTRIISNLIDDDRILQQLTDHREWFKCYENTRGKHTHWYDKNKPPSSVWEFLAIQMWKDQPFLEQEDFAGFEIWCNVLTPEGPLTWHIDKDQLLYEQSGELSLPLYGSVWYGYPHEFTGGYLELLKYDSDSWPPGMDEPDPDIVERIDAEYNRMVVFNASKFHRVSPVYSGARVTLAVNVWKEPPRAARVSETAL